jgi:hypothetical protein
MKENYKNSWWNYCVLGRDIPAEMRAAWHRWPV